MITKLLLQEKIEDINVKMDAMKVDAEAVFMTLDLYAEQIRRELKGYKFDESSEAEIVRMNETIDTYRDGIRDLKSSMYIFESDLAWKRKEMSRL